MRDSLTSLRSSILQYETENGRTYHAMSAGSEPTPFTLPSLAAHWLTLVLRLEYFLPNDDVRDIQTCAVCGPPSRG